MAPSHRPARPDPEESVRDQTPAQRRTVQAVQAEGMAAIVSTRDPLMIQLADRVVRLADGHLVDAGRIGA